MSYKVDQHGVLSDGLGCRTASGAEVWAFAEIERLRAALWPFAMRAIHSTEVCADDYRRAGEAMPHVPDHVQQEGDAAK